MSINLWDVNSWLNFRKKINWNQTKMTEITLNLPDKLAAKTTIETSTKLIQTGLRE